MFRIRTSVLDFQAEPYAEFNYIQFEVDVEELLDVLSVSELNILTNEIINH